VSASRGFPNWLAFVLAFVGVDVLLFGVFFGYLNLPAQVNTRLDRIERALDQAIAHTPDYTRMRDELRTLALLHPGDARVHAVTAQVEYQRGFRYSMGARAIHDPEALEAVMAQLQRALQLDSTLAQARRLEAAVLIERHQLDDAERAARDAERLAPRVATNQLVLADLAIAREDWEGAIRAADAARRMTPAAAVRIAAEQRLCDVWLKLGRVDQAESSYVAILRYAPKAAWAHHNYGLFLLHQKRFDDAIEREQKALAIDDLLMAKVTLSAAWYGKGLGCLFDSGQTELSKTCFENAIASDSTNANAWYGLAMYREARAAESQDVAMFASAGPALRRALALDPDNGLARAELLRYEQLRLSRAQLDSIQAEARRSQD